jgi:hypothetical protein
MKEVEVTFRDGTTRRIKAKEYKLTGEWFIFYGEDDTVVVTIAAKEVRSIGDPVDVIPGLA